ncbi:Photosynthetic reaction center cytochrome c subunit [Rhodovastum atsumiense]|uniref:Photosynthetic reaction center cytochrome c subunit n=1 Tax=Rhodovastum atsumiense TaxID=504468 RepID=A0A5M6IYH6_9PROT|nr:photosynthetic reaction center cytochrome PufC [Rhodovastum atsumiense]KAA5612877.1 photosynthetic reaction center cytochrome c subunit [Rhodovastum atsumiense]CAH2601047.1 Photosynthetic reaction center cytochrome c subunit [Rhodovastum atsumiense]
MKLNLTTGLGLFAAAAIGVGLLFTIEYPPVDVVQRGFRGLGMNQLFHPATVAKAVPNNTVPPALIQVPAIGGKAGDVYKNVQVLKDLPVAQFTRLMAAVTDWVAPQQGCTYCHVDANNLASDDIYTKVVSRRMFQMTIDINKNYKNHVAATGPEGANGVTCYTCHRGQPIPANIWFTDPASQTVNIGGLGDRAGKNIASPAAGYTSLPTDPFTPFLLKADSLRVETPDPLPIGYPATIKNTEWTYGFMFHLSAALGVNCTYCHNSRQFADWSQSTPQRVTAFQGIAMTRALNVNYLAPLQNVFPASRLGPGGDSPKVNCATCHQGTYKPLYGANMVKDYPELTR